VCYARPPHGWRRLGISTMRACRGAVGKDQLRLETVGIPDQRKHLFEPCAIVATYPVLVGELTVGRQTYRRTVFAPPVVLFLPEGGPDGAQGGDAPPCAYAGAGGRRDTPASNRAPPRCVGESRSGWVSTSKLLPGIRIDIGGSRVARSIHRALRVAVRTLQRSS
jgi:hypothetical protein